MQILNEGGLRLAGAASLAKDSINPLVSVVTVVWNGAHCLEQAIQSVLNQDYPNIEYIVIDGGSTDGTLDIIKKYEGRIDYWVSAKDKGIYDAMNNGIRLCRGEIVGLLNADDQYEPGALSTVSTAYLAAGGGGMILFGAYRVHGKQMLKAALLNSMSQQNGFLGIVRSFKNNFHDSSYVCIAPKLESLMTRPMICHQAVFVSNSLHSEKPYDLRYRFSADYHFLLRSFLAGVTFTNVNHVLVLYSGSGASFQNAWQMYFEKIMIFGELCGYLSLKFAVFLGYSLLEFFKLGVKYLFVATNFRK